MSAIRFSIVIEKIFKRYAALFKTEENGLLLFDPIDQKVIGFHYGETHLATAMMIWGDHTGNIVLKEDGRKVLIGFLNHVSEYQKQPAYHWDFNNFALCVLVNYFDRALKKVSYQEKDALSVKDKEFSIKIRDFILRQKDSDNPTINWLPMRMYVNHCKKIWTENNKFDETIDKLASNIQKAQYLDGFYEDLLPKGKSFNFQYHLYTTAVLAFLEMQGLKKVDNSKAIQKAISLVDPSGDINYLGRGINQIFAWGPAFFLYHSQGAAKVAAKTWEYFESRIDEAIDNDNLILSDIPGNQKNWWWDYHYASVYFAHLVFWLVLTQITYSATPFIPEIIKHTDSGVNIFETANYQVCVFEGRKHYLAEKGPIIANICNKDGQYLFKGAFGPFGGEYGKKYGIPNQTIHHQIGIIQEKIIAGYLIEKPLFCKSIEVEEISGTLLIRLLLDKRRKSVRLNLPILCDNRRISVVNDENLNLIMKNSGMVCGAYGLSNLYVSECITTDCFEIRITQ